MVIWFNSVITWKVIVIVIFIVIVTLIHFFSKSSGVAKLHKKVDHCNNKHTVQSVQLNCTICNDNKQPWNNNNQGSTINNNNYHKHQEQWWQWRSSGHSNQSFCAPVLNGKPHHCCCRTMNTHSLTHSKQLPHLQFFSLPLHSYDSTQLFFLAAPAAGSKK